MIFTTHPQKFQDTELIIFLKQKIGLSEKAIQLGLRQSEFEQAPLAIVLWSFGLVTLDQYQEILNWENDYS